MTTTKRQTTPGQTVHLAELLLRARLHGTKDGFRTKRGFSQDMTATQAVLFNPKYSKRNKVREYRKWLETYQPCVFGKIAAKNKHVFICLLEEDVILALRHGDVDLRDTIQDYRQVWKRHALDGLASSFLIVLVSDALTLIEPGEELKTICRRLLELYMEVDVPDDTILGQREYVFLRQSQEAGKARLLQFATLPNIFCAQADGRWWQDHRTPGGVMITSNALGHFLYARTGKLKMEDPTKGWALENAMRTISNAHRDKRLKHTPATFLGSAAAGQSCPFKSTSEFAQYSTAAYHGYFHTDHLIPSVFFQRGIDPAGIPQYDGLSLQYIHDEHADPIDHAELVVGTPATWYDVRRNMDRLPEFANPEKNNGLPNQVRGRLRDWLEARLQARL
jgi:hypothetical protein